MRLSITAEKGGTRFPGDSEIRHRFNWQDVTMRSETDFVIPTTLTPGLLTLIMIDKAIYYTRLNATFDVTSCTQVL